jgi:hypothetical protein
MKIPTSELEQQRFHLPNCWNCIQAAIFQIEKGNPQRATQFLESAQESLSAAISNTNQQSDPQR